MSKCTLIVETYKPLQDTHVETRIEYDSYAHARDRMKRLAKQARKKSASQRTGEHYTAFSMLAENSKGNLIDVKGIKCFWSWWD